MKTVYLCGDTLTGLFFPRSMTPGRRLLPGEPAALPSRERWNFSSSVIMWK